MVEARKLPPELVSLVHHVELNKAGWWDKAVQQLIVATIWLSGETLTPQGVLDKLAEYFSVNLDGDRVRNEIDALCASSILVPLQGERFKISEQSLHEFEEGLKEAEKIEEEAHHRFIDTMRECCPAVDAETTWRSFNEGFLVPLIRDTGARTYELISGATIDFAAIPRVQEFLERYSTEIRGPLLRAVVVFMDPKDPNIRSYILRQLCAYFFLEAGNLSDETVRALSTMQGKTPSFTLFVDTNFLFCILGLDEDPRNEAADSLVDLVERLAGNVALRLCVSSATIDEARWVLKSCEHELGGLRLTPNLADAALRSGLSGLTRKFIEENKKAGCRLRAEDYFGPSIDNLVGMARAKGVELSDQKVDHYRTSQEVVDDLNEELEFEKRFRDRPKGYEQLEHDIVLWHFVRDQRPVSIDSPVEAGCWIVTLDFRFLGFDRHKRRKRVGEIPTCVHPATLIQMLQFWVPRTQDFEEAVLGNLRLPFLFQEFGPDAERLTIRILDALARFENVGDLPQETVGSILLNDALRQRLGAEAAVQQQVELVREALVGENEKVRAELKAAQAKADELERKAATTIADLDQRGRQHKEAIKESKRQLEQERAAREDLEERLRGLERALQTKEERELAKAQLADFRTRWVIAPLGLILALGLAASLSVAYFTALGTLPSALTGAGVFSASLILWVWSADSRGAGDPVISEWRPFIRFHRFRKWLFAASLSPVGVVALNVAANALWDLIGAIGWP